jgi:diguanylate cyclase (GGDEF)-like protein
MKPSSRNRERIASAGRALWSGITSLGDRRSLIGEILGLQILFAIFLCTSAIGFLWWTSSWVVEDNLQNWGEQWISELDDLGMPLYTSLDEERYLRIERFVNAFPEIAFVRYYSADGEVIYTGQTTEAEVQIPQLDTEQLERLMQIDHTATDEAIVIEKAGQGIPMVRVSKPIWTESLAEDGMLDFDPENAVSGEPVLVGYAELALDFRNYQGQLNQNILTASLFGIIVLLLLTLASSVIFRRAMRPLTQLQKPLQELADGSTDFNVKTTGHREIVAIADAVNTTVTALNERDKMLWQLANMDSLTGLISRHRFSELLAEEVEKVSNRSAPTALLFVDLDQFKCVNDTLGHAAGDRFLAETAERLRLGVRKNDIVARFGGDEFTILIPDIKREEVEAICQALVKDMRDHHFMEAGETFSVPCSIGATLFDSNVLSPEELMAQADMACHDAKAKGRNRVQFYELTDREMNQQSKDAGWSQKIQQALKNDLFVMHYQPIVDIRSGRTTHFEALLRMQGDDGELVPPLAFLPAASRFGLMQEIDEWVIRNSLVALAGFRENDKDLRFTVNISGTIFEDQNLFNYIEKHLADNGLPPDCMILEITEQVAVRNLGGARRQVEMLSEFGCKFAIDDFGAGYSSYSYLKRLPVDYIKIDGSFIRDLATDEVDKTIVNSISQVAKATNKLTIAEHVGDAATYSLLLDLGVDYAQGFYVGKPAADLVRPKMPATLKTTRKRRKRAG